MRFLWASFDDILELNGEIEFPKDKVVVLYGANLQGKTNVINAIRFAFLREAKRGRRKIKYDDWALPTRQEVVSDGKANIEVAFEHDGGYYKLHREISAGGRKDVPTLHILTGWPGKEVRTLDLEPFVKERLKAGLLDALFAPEIAGGFKRLYGRDIDEAISEVFKEVIAARQISSHFILRLTKLKSGAEAETARIVDAHRKYCSELLDLLKGLSKIPEFRNFRKFQPGKTFEKMEKLLEVIRTRIKSLEKDDLFLYLRDMLGKSDDLLKLREAFSEEERMKELLVEIKKATPDVGTLHNLIVAYSKITTIEDEIDKPPTFSDTKLGKKVNRIYGKLIKAQELHREAEKGVRKYDSSLETLKDSIKGLDSVITVLRSKRKIREEKQATVTKLGKIGYTVIPVKLLTEDPTFARLSDQPIPKGSEREKKSYLKTLEEKRDALSDFLKKERSSARRFNNLKKKDLVRLSELENELNIELKKMSEKVVQWANKIITQLSAFTGVSVKTRSIESDEDVNSLLDYAKNKANKKEREYLKSLNERIQPLGLEIETFRKKEMDNVLTKLKKERLELPAYRKIRESLDSNKEEWRLLDEIYIDYNFVPKMVDKTVPLLNTIINESVDETKLKEEIANTYNEIIEKMKERKLIRAVAEMSKGSIQAQVKYKDKVITHPGGAEKAFFSLAILTALGDRFGMPILIDEVANNLDSNNLPAFFNLVAEFKNEKRLQYVLSIKETRDFDFEGWVKDIADDIAVYELKEKQILKKII